MAGLFRPWTPLIVPPELSPRVLDRMLPMLVAIDRDWLEMHPKAPTLYGSGVRYKAEAPGEEKWLTVPWNLLAMAGDCEDLACWRVAELQLGIDCPHPEPNAQAIYISQDTPQGLLYHIQVRHEDGRIEDPCILLGMGFEREYQKKHGPLHGMTDMDEPWTPVSNRVNTADVMRELAAARAQGSMNGWGWKK